MRLRHTTAFRRSAIAVTSVFLLTLTPQAMAAQPDAKPFEITEATIGSIHQAFAAGTLSCVDLVQSYIDRIETYDQPADGQGTNAVQAVNKKALKDAKRLDRQYARSGLTGPLHCIPVLVKDQVETKDMPTTYGSALFANFRSGRDATIVSKMREAGAIMLAKTNMGEFASGWAGSAFGLCRNPYDLARAPSSSSCGTGAGIAANYGAIGIAEDTGGSTRGPAAWNNAVGLRPTTPLISRYGAMPAQPTYDTLGPLTRTVRDAATLTTVIAGYDPKDPLTSVSIGHVEENYADDLDRDDLKGKRIGIIREPMSEDTDPTQPDYARVRATVDQAYSDLTAQGAEVVDPIEIPDLRSLLAAYDEGAAETEAATNAYLDGLPHSPVDSFREMATSPVVTPTRQESLREAMGRTTAEPAYQEAHQKRERLRALVLGAMEEHDLDAIAYATFDHEPPVIPEDQLTNPDALDGVIQGSNRSLAPVIGLPALAVPAGLTSAGLPVGLELLGRPFAEESLFEMGYAYEQATMHRTAPNIG